MNMGIFCGSKGYLIVDNINNPLNIDIYEETLRVMRIMDSLREKWGLISPREIVSK